METDATDNPSDVASLDAFSLKQGVLHHVAITEIRPYEHNPRQCPNEEYDRIKASIRVQGLDQPLIITRRPGEQHYILLAGGDTRHQALSALYEETGDNKFLEVPCLIKPWVNESSVLLAHLRENELRDHLIFIDKARAVMAMKALLEQEEGGKRFSQRALAKILTARGLAYSQGVISRMDYAVNRLLPLIPHALNNGLGRFQIDRIRRLENVAQALWCEWQAGSEDEFRETFAVLCKRYDSLDWDIEPLQYALEGEIAMATEQNINKVRLEVDVRLAGRRLPPVFLEPLPPPAPAPSNRVQEPTPPTQRHVTDNKPEPLAADATAAAQNTPPAVDGAEEVSDSDGAVRNSRHTTLNHRRVACKRLACSLVDRYGLANTVIPLERQGLGFLVVDVPDQELAEVLDGVSRAVLFGLWWSLLTLSDLLEAPLAAVQPHLRAESALHRARVENDHILLYDTVTPLAPHQIGARFWRRLTATDIKELCELISQYNALHRYAMANGINLWLRQEP